MPSIRLSFLPLLILAALPLAGCGYSRDACWPAGTEAVVSDPDPESQGILVRVPRDQQNKISRDSLVLRSQTPVVIVNDSVFRAATAGGMRGTSPMDPVLVRIVKDRQGIEVFVRRRELAPRPGSYAWAISFVPVAVLLLFAAAGVFWTIEAIVLLFMRMRSDQTELHLGPLPLHALATVLWRARRRSRLNERTDEDCERWREWIAEKTARRKAICARLRARRLRNGSGVG